MKILSRLHQFLTRLVDALQIQPQQSRLECAPVYLPRRRGLR